MPFVEREMRIVYGEDWEDEARSALRTPPDVLLHWDSQAVLNVIDRRWNDVFRRKLEKKHRSWVIEAVALRHDLMHEKKQMFSDKETIRGLDTVECLLAAVSAPESHEVALLKNAVGEGPPAPHANNTVRDSAARVPVGQPVSGIESQVLPIFLVPSDPVMFKQQLLRSRIAEIVTTYSDGKVETRTWRAANFSASSNVIGNLRSRPEFRAGQWKVKGIVKVTVRVLENA